jgi:hypothetical protein
VELKFFQPACRINSVRPLHRYIQNYQIWHHNRRLLDGFPSVTRFAAYFDFGRFELPANIRIIVNRFERALRLTPPRS